MNVSPRPQVSVLMAAHNEDAYIGGAIDSLLVQTFADFELIVVDDASSDGTGARLRAVCDPRVRVLRNTTCQGLTRSLIAGMAAARAPFIARLDADDLALPRRLEEQVAALRAETALGLVGSDCACIDPDGRRCGSRQMPASDLAIRWRSLFDNPFIHSAVMFRADAYVQAGGYNAAFATSQDYDLWRRMLLVTKARNLPRRLIAYRIRPENITHRNRQQQLANHDRVSWQALADAGLEHLLPLDRHQLIRALFAGGPPSVAPNEIVPLVIDYWALLAAFHARHAAGPGWWSLLGRERLRCLRRLLRAPPGAVQRRAWACVLSPVSARW